MNIHLQRDQTPFDARHFESSSFSRVFENKLLRCYKLSQVYFITKNIDKIVVFLSESMFSRQERINTHLNQIRKWRYPGMHCYFRFRFFFEVVSAHLKISCYDVIKGWMCYILRQKRRNRSLCLSESVISSWGECKYAYKALFSRKWRSWRNPRWRPPRNVVSVFVVVVRSWRKKLTRHAFPALVYNPNWL